MPYFKREPLVGTRVLQSQTFLTSGTFTVPAEVRELYVQCTGAGAGGYITSGEVVNYYGGGGSGMVASFLQVVPGEQYVVTVGAPSGANQPANGGTTTFGSAVTCTGGLTPAGHEGMVLNTNSSVVHNYSGVFVSPGINGIVAPSFFTGGGFAISLSTSTTESAGGPGGFGNGTTSASNGINVSGTANSGAGGGINTYNNVAYGGGSGRCVVYWFTYN